MKLIRAVVAPGDERAVDFGRADAVGRVVVAIGVVGDRQAVVGNGAGQPDHAIGGVVDGGGDDDADGIPLVGAPVIGVVREEGRIAAAVDQAGQSAGAVVGIGDRSGGSAGGDGSERFGPLTDGVVTIGGEQALLVAVLAIERVVGVGGRFAELDR